jgi:hypothetical protein
MTTWIHFMSKKKLIHFGWENTGTQGILKECLVLPTQRNGYHLSSEWQISETQEILKYHEALRKYIHFCKDSLRDNTVHLSFMELNTYRWSDKMLFLNMTLGIQPNFYKSVNSKLNQKYHTHTHRHTHKYTNTYRKKWPYPNCYLVN